MVEVAKDQSLEHAQSVLKEAGIEVDVDYFLENGCGIVRNFATQEECQGMMD